MAISFRRAAYPPRPASALTGPDPWSSFVSDVDGVAQGPQRRLVEGLAQGRVDVDHPGDVFQHRAHLQHLGEAVGHLRHVLADGLNAQQAGGRSWTR